MNLNFLQGSWLPKLLGFIAMASGVVATYYLDSTATFAGLLVWKFAGMIGVISGSGIGFVTRQDNVPSEETGAKAKLPNVVPLVLFAFLLAGCETATPTRKQAEQAERTARDLAYQNLSDQYDAQEKANIINYTKRIDLELKHDLSSLDVQSKIEPIKWTPAAIAAETSRLQALHDSKIVAYKESLLTFRKLKEKNEAVNIGTANKIRDALANPKPAAPLNQSAEIQASTGVTKPVPLIQE